MYDFVAATARSLPASMSMCASAARASADSDWFVIAMVSAPRSAPLPVTAPDRVSLRTG